MILALSLRPTDTSSDFTQQLWNTEPSILDQMSDTNIIALYMSIEYKLSVTPSSMRSTALFPEPAFDAGYYTGVEELYSGRCTFSQEHHFHILKCR